MTMPLGVTDADRAWLLRRNKQYREHVEAVRRLREERLRWYRIGYLKPGALEMMDEMIASYERWAEEIAEAYVTSGRDMGYSSYWLDGRPDPEE